MMKHPVTFITFFSSFVGTRIHRPRWAAGGELGMAVGMLVFTLPHFLTDVYDWEGGTADVTDLCVPGSNATRYYLHNIIS